jgi:hypothetical protein
VEMRFEESCLRGSLPVFPWLRNIALQDMAFAFLIKKVIGILMYRLLKSRWGAENTAL